MATTQLIFQARHDQDVGVTFSADSECVEITIQNEPHADYDARPYLGPNEIEQLIAWLSTILKQRKGKAE